jgi:monofunctional biosynthetic peptidoglycan transglycosylase
VVDRDGLDGCVYKGAPPPVNKAPPKVSAKPRPLPGEEYETAAPPSPPVENAVQEAPPATEQPTAPQPVNSAEPVPPPADPQEPANQL